MTKQLKVTAMLPKKYRLLVKVFYNHKTKEWLMSYTSPNGDGGFVCAVGNTTARALRKWSFFK